MPFVRGRICKVPDTDQDLRGEGGYHGGVLHARGAGTGDRGRRKRVRECDRMRRMQRRGGRGRGVFAFLVVIRRVEERLQLCREAVLGLAHGGAAAAVGARFALRVGTGEGGGGARGAC